MLSARFTLKPTLLLHAIAALLLCGSATLVSAQEIRFSAAQVEAGIATYKETCQLCHGTTMANGQFGTPLRGSYFRKKWAGKSVGELLQFTLDSMPPDNKGGLAPEKYAAVLAYVFSRNELLPGETELSADPQALTSVMLPWQP